MCLRGHASLHYLVMSQYCKESISFGDLFIFDSFLFSRRHSDVDDASSMLLLGEDEDEDEDGKGCNGENPQSE